MTYDDLLRELRDITTTPLISDIQNKVNILFDKSCDTLKQKLACLHRITNETNFNSERFHKTAIEDVIFSLTHEIKRMKVISQE